MSDAKKRLAMRQRGYADGLAGRKARSREAIYQEGWRRGREQRERVRGALVE